MSDAVIQIVGGSSIPVIFGGPPGLPGEIGPAGPPMDGWINVFSYMTGVEQTAVEDRDLSVNVTDALTAASEALEAQGGGTLFLPPGDYLVGKQTFQGTLLDGVTPAAYGPQPIITVNDVGTVRILGYGARLVSDPEMRYGSFDPVTGLRYDPPSLPFVDYDYYSYPYRGMINLTGNESVIIEGVELDGNNENIVLGGYWGDSQWQLEGHGLVLANNDRTSIKDVYSHHHPGDGMVLSVSPSTYGMVPKSSVVDNFKAHFNGRQGISLVGGRNVVFINCDLSHTGKAMNGAEAMQTAPGCGIDIEAEGGIIRDIVFINPYMMDNFGAGFGAASGNSGRVTVYGGHIEELLVSRWAYHFHSVTFLGQTSIGIPATNEYEGDRATLPEEGPIFENCLFTYDAEQTEAGALDNDAQSLWNEARYGQFRNCVIDTGAQLLPSGSIGPFDETHPIFENCIWRSTYVGAENVARHGRYRGVNQFSVTDTLILDIGTNSRIEYGKVYVNDIEQLAPVARSLFMVDDSGGNTRVTPRVTPTGEVNLIEKVAGAAGYNAAAISPLSITGDHLLKLHWLNGTVFGGVSTNPTAGDDYTWTGPKIFNDGVSVQAYSGGSTIGPFVVATHPYTWIKRISATDTFEFYWGDVDDFSLATLFHTEAAYGLGDTWQFDSSITTVGGAFEAQYLDT